MNKPKREDYATAADFNFWMCAWQHDEIDRLRGLLTRMLQWDQFNPPMTGDHAWWKQQIRDALAGAADQPDAALPFDAIQIHGHELRLVYQGKPMAAWRFDPRDSDSTWTLAGGIEGRASLTLAADSIAAPTPTPQPAAAPKPKRAYYETHEPPHCPTCECGADNAAAQPAAALRDPDAELREFAGFLTAYLPELHAFEVPRMLDAIAAFRAADNSGAAT